MSHAAPRSRACGGLGAGSHAISTSASAATTAVAAARWITLIGASLSSSRRRRLEACPRACSGPHPTTVSWSDGGSVLRLVQSTPSSPAVVLHLRLRVSAGFRPASPNPSSAGKLSGRDVGELRRGVGRRLRAALEEAPAVDCLVLHRAARGTDRRVRPARAAEPVGPVLRSVRAVLATGRCLGLAVDRADETALVQPWRRGADAGGSGPQRV